MYDYRLGTAVSGQLHYKTIFSDLIDFRRRVEFGRYRYNVNAFRLSASSEPERLSVSDEAERRNVRRYTDIDRSRQIYYIKLDNEVEAEIRAGRRSKRRLKKRPVDVM